MGNKYSHEFNRSFPHQTEGPEIAPYANKASKGKRISISVTGVVATLAVVAVVAVVLASPLGFFVDNINSTAAELFFDVGEEAGFLPEDVVLYRLLCSGEVVSEEELPHEKGSIPILGLTPDTYYTVRLIRNGELLKTIDFRTPPVMAEALVPTEDTTLAPSPDETVAPPVTTAPPPVTTAPPPVTTAPPPVTTAPPPVTTAPPPVTTAPPPVTTAPPPVTTAPPPVTTAPPPVTTAPPPVTTAPPPVTTAPPPVTTAPPPVTTAPPPVTTAPPPVTTAPPPVTTAPPPVTTAPPPVTTAPPPVTTAPPPVTTAPPPVTTAPPPVTTAPPPETTAPPAVRPSMGAVEFVQQKNTYNVDVSTTIIPNDGEILSVILVIDGEEKPMTAQGEVYTLTLEGLSAGKYSCTVKLSYRLEGKTYMLTKNSNFTVTRALVELEFVSLSGKPSTELYTATLNMGIKLNDSTIRSVSVKENGKSLANSRRAYIITVTGLSVGTHTITVTVNYTTGTTVSSASRTVEVTIAPPPGDMVVENDFIFAWEENLYFDGAIIPNDATDITAIFATQDGKKLGDVEVQPDGEGKYAWLSGSVLGLPPLEDREYEIYKIIFYYKLGGVDTSKSVNVLICQYGYAAYVMFGANPSNTIGTYDVYFSTGDVFIDANIKSIVINVVRSEDESIVREAFSKTYTSLVFSDLNNYYLNIGLTESPGEVYLQLKITYEIGGFEFTMTEYCGLA